MLDLERARGVIREEGFSAWFLHNVFHRDEISDLVLGVPSHRTNTRPWACVLTVDAPPVKIVHAIEPSILDDVPGSTLTYANREQFKAAVARALPRAGLIAADYSSAIPVGSFLDHGTALLLQSLGAKLAPAETLVARYLGAIDASGRASHDAAATFLYGVVSDTWQRLREGMQAGKALTEGDVRDWIQEAIAAGGFQSDGPPVVGTGAHSGDPHYGAQGKGSLILRGDVVQLDIWARSPQPGSVFADIAWVGVCAPAPTPAQERAFDAVRGAREAALALLEQRLSTGKPVSGADVDRAARAVLIEKGFEKSLRHRTGHSIGGRVHGFGVNLDSEEFPDQRLLSDGACFSVEPGIYGSEFGMRSEVDCVIDGGRLVVTGRARQESLLTLG